MPNPTRAEFHLGIARHALAAAHSAPVALVATAVILAVAVVVAPLIARILAAVSSPAATALRPTVKLMEARLDDDGLAAAA